jgi:1-acyl-sn-glycerol-3-phosphate acyltransferase
MSSAPVTGLPAPRWTAAAAAKIALIALACLVALPAHGLILRFAPRQGLLLPRHFHRFVCKVLGVRITVVGEPPPRRERTLIVANHVSWLDIPVIGARRPVSFIAKSEIAGWPVISHLARLQRTIFIDRGRRGDTAGVSAAVGERLVNGDDIVLFAEGTTGDGSRILPFRSSLLGAVKQALGPEGEGEILVQPLAVLYTGRHGLPGGRHGRAELAWTGDIALAPHLAAVLSGGPIDVSLVWGDPMRLGANHSRKEAARLAEEAVRAAARRTFRGRD